MEDMHASEEGKGVKGGMGGISKRGKGRLRAIRS